MVILYKISHFRKDDVGAKKHVGAKTKPPAVHGQEKSIVERELHPVGLPISTSSSNYYYTLPHHGALRSMYQGRA